MGLFLYAAEVVYFCVAEVSQRLLGDGAAPPAAAVDDDDGVFVAGQGGGNKKRNGQPAPPFVWCYLTVL